MVNITLKSHVLMLSCTLRVRHKEYGQYQYTNRFDGRPQEFSIWSTEIANYPRRYMAYDRPICVKSRRLRFNTKYSSHKIGKKIKVDFASLILITNTTHLIQEKYIIEYHTQNGYRTKLVIVSSEIWVGKFSTFIKDKRQWG